MTADRPETPHEELVHDRHVEWWLLVKAVAAAILVAVFVVLRERYFV